MFSPSISEVLSYSSQYNFIPIRLSILADQETPIRIYHKLRSTNSFLLESVEGGSRWARYSFIGLHPFLKLEAKGEAATISKRGEEDQQVIGNPVLLLQELMKDYQSPQLPGFPR